ncbi:hypothetical protein ACRAWD_14970 [Caulobacter segnis]
MRRTRSFASTATPPAIRCVWWPAARRCARRYDERPTPGLPRPLRLDPYRRPRCSGAARPRHDVRAASSIRRHRLTLPTPASCSSRPRGCLPMCGHGTIGIVTLRAGAGPGHPARAGQAAAGSAGRGHRHRLPRPRATGLRR